MLSSVPWLLKTKTFRRQKLEHETHQKSTHEKLYIWYFWINTVTKECFIAHTARVAHVVRSTFLTCYLWLICNTEVNGWKWELKPGHLFPFSRIRWTFKINTVYFMSFLRLERSQTNNDFTKFACYSSLLTDTCPNKLLPMDYLKGKAIICT